MLTLPQIEVYPVPTPLAPPLRGCTTATTATDNAPRHLGASCAQLMRRFAFLPRYVADDDRLERDSAHTEQ